MTIYFEFSDAILSEVAAKYCCIHDSKNNTNVYHYMRFANRAWIEDSDGIRFTKHRSQDPRTAIVDLEEFFWIKLQSVLVK